MRTQLKPARRLAGREELIEKRVRKELRSLQRTREYSSEDRRESDVTSSDLEAETRQRRDPNRYADARLKLIRCAVRITIAIIAISLATSVVSNVLTLTQLQLFTSSEAFNIALQESSPVRNTNRSRGFVTREAEGLRLLFWQRKIASTGTTPLLEMLFAVQHEIEIRQKAMNLFPAIRALVVAIHDATKLYSGSFAVKTFLKISRKLLKDLKINPGVDNRRAIGAYLATAMSDIKLEQ
jgi:hypothetical protein